MIRTVIRRRSRPRRGPAGIPPDEWRNPPFRRFLTIWGRCAVCLAGGCDPAHGPVNGGSSKGPDCECIPLCPLHHAEQHAIGWPAFEALHEINRLLIAVRWWAMFQILKQRKGL
jgi:hypothetical protein